MSVMMAVRPHLMRASPRGARTRAASRSSGRPPFVLKAQADLHGRLTGLFEPHRDELAVEPDGRRHRAAQPDLRRRAAPSSGMAPALTPDQIADLAARRRPHARREA